MGFEKFGKSGYVSQTKIEPFVSYLEKDEVRGTRCVNCKRPYFPPRADCLDCRDGRVEWVRIDGACRLVSFTEIYFAPPAFQQDTPYLLGVAELKNGLRVFAPIKNQVNRKELKPGLELALRPVRTPGDSVFYQLEKQHSTTRGFFPDPSPREKRRQTNKTL